MSQDIKSKGDDMRCNDTPRERKVEGKDVVHDTSRTRHRSSSISHTFGLSPAEGSSAVFLRQLYRDARTLRLRFLARPRLFDSSSRYSMSRSRAIEQTRSNRADRSSPLFGGHPTIPGQRPSRLGTANHCPDGLTNRDE